MNLPIRFQERRHRIRIVSKTQKILVVVEFYENYMESIKQVCKVSVNESKQM